MEHSMMDDYTLYQYLTEADTETYKLKLLVEMIQKLTTLLFILCLTLSVQAQKKPGFSKEEFRAKQEAYLTQKAELTAEEAGKFFPIYFELQDRKKSYQ